MAKITLAPEETLNADSKALVAMSSWIQVESKMRSGVINPSGRMGVKKDRMFVNTYRTVGQDGEVLLAPRLPGDVAVRNLEARVTVFVRPDSYLASSETVDVVITHRGARSFTSGEGLPLLRCGGEGVLVFASFGALHEITLDAEETYTADAGHLVALSDTVHFRLRQLGGVKGALLLGQDLVLDLEGPGKVYMQTRSQWNAFDWLRKQLVRSEDLASENE